LLNIQAYFLISPISKERGYNFGPQIAPVVEFTAEFIGSMSTIYQTLKEGTILAKISR